MANYSLVINSKFKPFSYQELLQPALMATQAHQAIEDAYGELDTKASIWDNLTEGSTKAKAQYQRFANDLAKEAEQLSKYGLNPASRQAMLNMRGRYSRDIIPIETAYKKREVQAEEQRKAMLANPTLLLSRRAAETNLDEYLDNPDLGYDMTTGALLQQQVATAASALAKAARNDPKVQTELRHLLGFNYETIRRKGFAPEEVQKAILGAADANPELLDIVNKTIGSSGIEGWRFASDADKARILKQARDYASQGLWSAVGETQYGTVSDDRARALFEHSLAMQRQAAANKDKPIPEGNPKYRRIANTKVQGNTKQLQDDLGFLQNLSKTGVNKLSKKSPAAKLSPYEIMKAGEPGHTQVLKQTKSDYERVMERYKNIAKKYGINTNAWGPNVNKTLIDKLSKDIERNIVRTSTYQMNMTDQSQLAQILEENSNTWSANNRNRSGFRTIDDKGRLGDYIDTDAAGEMFGTGNKFNLSYDIDRGFQLSYRDKDNKFTTVYIDPELINFGDNDYTLGHRQVQKYMNAGDYENASSLINDMMNSLYYRFNTQGIKQTATGEIK